MSEDYDGFGREYVCPICGKKFLVSEAGKWAYKIYKVNRNKQLYKLVCSWKCLRAHEKKG